MSTTPLETFKSDVVDAAITYEGRTSGLGDESAEPDAATAIWQIKRIKLDGNITTTLYAGDGVYNQVWDDRATLFP